MKKLNSAIIAAGGRGTRLDPARPKQFLELLGKPIIIHTLERFERCDAIDEIVLVLPADELNTFVPIAESANITKLKKIVVGGPTRAVSVKNGLDAVDEASEVVAVHDAARPLISEADIINVVQRAAKVGAACPVAAVTDTVKTVEGGYITGTVDRTKLRRALTPQAFRYDILKRAFEDTDLGEDVTDECYLVEKLGLEVAAVEGDSRNIKITRPEDLVVAEAYLRSMERERK